MIDGGGRCSSIQGAGFPLFSPLLFDPRRWFVGWLLGSLPGFRRWLAASDGVRCFRLSSALVAAPQDSVDISATWSRWRRAGDGGCNQRHWALRVRRFCGGGMRRMRAGFPPTALSLLLPCVSADDEH
nr:hypothetical protein Itr_chr08CG08450 [Ipomoea trifida]GMD03906.1 hypothetical protein Iba_chr06aCG13380 [Ipomoea batatas]